MRRSNFGECVNDLCIFTSGIYSGSVKLNWFRMLFTGISSPSLPLSTPLQPWDIRLTINREQLPTIPLKELSIIHWSSPASLQSILMTSHPVVCRACSRSSASAAAPCLPAEQKRISPYLLLFFCLCGIMYWELWRDNCCICSVSRDSVSVILCIRCSLSARDSVCHHEGDHVLWRNAHQKKISEYLVEKVISRLELQICAYNEFVLLV